MVVCGGCFSSSNGIGPHFRRSFFSIADARAEEQTTRRLRDTQNSATHHRVPAKWIGHPFSLQIFFPHPAEETAGAAAEETGKRKRVEGEEKTWFNGRRRRRRFAGHTLTQLFLLCPFFPFLAFFFQNETTTRRGHFGASIKQQGGGGDVDFRGC
jgi:hypothetical protein